MPETNHLGDFIRECRTGLGYTSRRVEELTRSRPGLAAISHSNLLAIEKGSHVPTFDKILTLSSIFNIPTRHFEDRLKQDMIGEAPVAVDTTFEQSMREATDARDEGHMERALELFIQAHHLATTEETSPEESASRQAETRLQAANCRKRLGLLRVAKDDLEELLGSDTVPTEVAVRSSFLLAEVYRDLKNYRLALLHAKAALELGDESGDPVLRARILNTVANILDDRGETLNAIRYYREALDVFVELSDRRAMGLVSRNLGIAHLNLGQTDAALAYFRDGVRIARETNDRRGLAYGLANLARADYLEGDSDRSREAAKEAKQIAQAENYPDVLFASLFYLWKAALRQRETSLSRVYADRLGSLFRKLESRSAEAEEWSRHVTASRRIRA